MLVNERFEGSRLPFEGNRLLVLRGLPEGARVTKAVLTLEPVAPPGGVLFEEDIAFTGDQGEWGARRLETALFAEVDFHARRTLSRVAGSGLATASLQVDLGGLYVSINALGAMSSPDDGVNDFTLSDLAGGLLPSLATQKFKLSLAVAGNPRIARVGVRSAPSNLSLRLGSQPAFWARPGELARAEVVPDFAVVLNAFLAAAKAQDGYYEVPLTLRSDSLCRLDVTVDIDYVQTQAALPGGLSEAALSFDHGTLPAGAENPVTVRLPAGARVLPGQTTARVRGSFADSRILCGPTGRLDPTAAVRVSPERAQAMPLVFNQGLAVSSVDLLLASLSRTAELALDLVEDADGKPYTRSLLPAQVRLAIDSQVQGRPTWVHVPLPAEVQIKAGTRLWLVMQSRNGEAGWGVANQAQVAAAAERGAWTAGEAIAADQANGAPLGLLYTDTGGLSWRAESVAGVAGPLVGFAHLRQPPSRYRVPIELEVGQGEAARRVSLQRFEPLGRVDFDLGFAEVAEAINQAAAVTLAAVPKGEHLGNGELEDWRRVGDIPAEDPIRFSLEGIMEGLGSRRMNAVAASPDGRRIVLGMGTGRESTAGIPADRYFLLAANQACLGVEGVCLLDAGPPQAIAIGPDGRRGCVSAPDTLEWVDLETWQSLGVAELDAPAGRTVFSPDGSRLYVKRYFAQDTTTGTPTAGFVRILDVAMIEKACTSGHSFSVDDVQAAAPIPLGAFIEPVDLAVSPDGALLYVLLVDRNVTAMPALLRAYDTASSQEAMRAVAVGTNPKNQDLGDLGLPRGGLAISRDGSRAVVVNAGSGEVAVVATPNGILLGLKVAGAPPEFGATPVDVVVHPDGNYAVIADYFGSRLIAYDIARLRVARYYYLSLLPLCLAVLSGGERVFAACDGLRNLPTDSPGSLMPMEGLAALPFGTLVPEEWSLTSGRVQRLCAPPPFDFGAVLGDFSGRAKKARKAQSARRPTAVSQVVPVVGGASYALSFQGLATTPETLAEIFWYGAGCAVQRTDRLPFVAYADGEQMKTGLERILARGGAVPDMAAVLSPHRLVAESPAGAQQAELRFSVPANEAAVVDRVSLKATADAMANGDLQQLDQGQLVGWTLTPPGAAGVVLVSEAGGLRLRNAGAKEAALEQATGFRPEAPFELAFLGRGEASPANAEPRVELAFLDEAGSALGTSLGAGIGAQGSNRLDRRGESPAGTAAALVRLVVPPGASLLAQRIALEEVAMVEVPLNFVAQAPGDLRISGLEVVYEMAPPARPKKLSTGEQCSPTPPAGAPGHDRCGCCYCPCCGEADDLSNVQETETPGGQPAVEGECRHCGTRQLQIGGGARTAAIVAAADRPRTLTPSAPDRTAKSPSATRAAAPVAVTARLLTRGARPLVVRAATVAPVVRRSFSADGPALTPAAPPAAVVLEAVSPETTPPELALPEPISAEPTPLPPPMVGPVEEAPVGASPAVGRPEGAVPWPPTPPITRVTGVTAPFAARLAAAGLDSLTRLAQAKPSAIAAILVGEKPGTVKRIARNARRLLRKVTSPYGPPGL